MPECGSRRSVPIGTDPSQAWPAAATGSLHFARRRTVRGQSKVDAEAVTPAVPNYVALTERKRAAHLFDSRPAPANRRSKGGRTVLMARGKLEINTNGMTGDGTEIRVDGHDISDMCSRIELDVGVGQINRTVLTLMPGSIEVDGEALAEVKAVLDLTQDGAS
jgi:hypothetical protein